MAGNILRGCVVTVVLTVALATVSSATAASYIFNNITDSTGPLFSFGSPSINNAGTVAFTADIQAGGFGVFAGNGGALTTIADNSGPFIQLSDHPAINTSGTVAFLASSSGSVGIYTGNGGPLTTVVETGGPFVGFPTPPSINDSGAVAFTASLSGFPPGSAVYVANGGSISPIAYPDGTVELVSFFGQFSINSGGMVGVSDERGHIFTGSGGSLTIVADTLGPFSAFIPSSLNDSGTVAFLAQYDIGGSGIFTVNGGSVTTIVDDSGSFSSIDGYVSLNNSGTVAFVATPNSDGLTGIFTGPDPVLDKVLQKGDPLFGSTVKVIFYTAINDNGDIAFDYILFNGVNGIAVAHLVNAVPEPATAGMLAVAGLIALRVRRQ